MAQQTVLRIGDVMARTGLARSTLYLRIQQGTFPRPIALGSQYCKGFLAAEVDEWISERVRQSRGESPDAVLQSA